MRTLLPRRTTRARGRLAAFVCAAPLLLTPGACNIVAPVAYLAGGPPKKPAQHELDEDRPTVIFVDDRSNAAPRRSLRTSIGQEAESVLIEQGVVEQEKMIASSSTIRVALQERFGEPRSIDAIGEAVGAEVVIYVELVSWAMASDGALSPQGRINVKVLDVLNDARLWPAGPDGRTITIQLPPITGGAPQNRAELNAMEERLARRIGLEVARLFFAHEPDALSGRLDD